LKGPLRDYFEAAALGNGNLRRFAELAGRVPRGLVALHFFLIALALHFPVLFAAARLSPWELFSRLQGDAFAEAASPLGPGEFNELMYENGYGSRVLLPLLGLSFVVVLVLQGVFYLLGALLLALHRITRSRLSFRERVSLFVMGSTLPVLGSSIIGLWIPTVHIVIFYLAAILLGFRASGSFDDYDYKTYKSGESMNGYVYAGDDLGAVYGPEKTVFKVWAPGADALELLLFEEGRPVPREEPLRCFAMKRRKGGLWEAEAPGDWKNRYYVYSVSRGGETKITVDPYARAAGVNGWRGMVADLPATDPPGFREQERPPLASPLDAVIYELHLRDLSMHPQSGIKNRGKFLGLTEGGTKNALGLSTGLDHIRELGLTHIHLLPSFDFKTVDETGAGPQFNWGYDPQNYNLPEGSYSTDPFHGEVRIREFKLLVQALHARGLRVVMDVVYNHTFDAAASAFSALAPEYYYRMKAPGLYSDGSACGNETASERPMMRKFIIDSVVYWAREYRVDGFRFDLMGLHDVETMNLLRAELDKVDRSIIIYGEGWTAGDTPLAPERRAVKENAPLLDERIALFSDDFRDGLKGSVFLAGEPGFVNLPPGAAPGLRDEDVKFGIAGGVRHPGVDLGRVSYSKSFWAKEPSQALNYVSAHDNLSLWDKLAAASPGADEGELLRQNKLAAAILFTSQGIPFFQAGEEMARTKGGDENSYRSPDRVNQLDWERKSRFTALTDYYRGLIALRRAYSAIRLPNAEALRERLSFLPSPPGLILYTLEAGEAYAAFFLAFNGRSEEVRAALPEGDWELLVNGETAGTRPLGRFQGGELVIPGRTALVFGRRA
jgi:pullulanase